jgi:hypothetical protein
MANVSIVFDAFSVTTTRSPRGVNATSTGPAAPADSDRVEPSERRWPWRPTAKPLTFATPPVFSTYASRPWTAMLSGARPCEGSRSTRRRRSPRTRNTETSFEPGLTANRRRPASVSAPCVLPAPAPLPRPPVA